MRLLPGWDPRRPSGVASGAGSGSSLVDEAGGFAVCCSPRDCIIFWQCLHCGMPSNAMCVGLILLGFLLVHDDLIFVLASTMLPKSCFGWEVEATVRASQA